MSKIFKSLGFGLGFKTFASFWRILVSVSENLVSEKSLGLGVGQFGLGKSLGFGFVKISFGKKCPFWFRQIWSRFGQNVVLSFSGR